MVNFNISTLQKIQSSGWNIFWAKMRERTNATSNTVTITMGFDFSTESRTSYRVLVNVPKIDTLDDWDVGNEKFS